MGLRVGSPRRGDSSPKTGSVLHKAAFFESSPTKKNGKDPAELSVAERLAMFERNRGQALIPKAAFSMPVPTKYLAGQKGVSNKVCSPGKGNKIVNNMVAQLQESVVSNINPKTVLPPGKGSGHILKQADKSCVAVTALSPPAGSEGMNIIL
jgi:actin-binding protein anillin